MTSPHSTDQLLQRLTAQVQHLEQLIQDQAMLGFTQGRQFIYIQNTKRSLWNFIADDEPVKATALTGYIIDLYRKEDEIPKLHVVMRTRDSEYVLCSGFETHFSRDVMAAIAQLTPEQAQRPLKIMPCLKDLKPRREHDEKSVKKPVYANVLLDDKTLYTHQLKQQYNAEELFLQAQRVLSGAEMESANPIPETQETEDRNPVVKAPQQAPQVSLPENPRPNTKTTLESVDWKSFCRQHGILPGVLKALAQELGLPMGKLNPRQSALLYQQAYRRFVTAA